MIIGEEEEEKSKEIGNESVKKNSWLQANFFDYPHPIALLLLLLLVRRKSYGGLSLSQQKINGKQSSETFFCCLLLETNTINLPAETKPKDGVSEREKSHKNLCFSF